MSYTDYLIAKFIVLAFLAFFGNFFYTFFTGRSLTQDRNDRAAAEAEDRTRSQ